MSIPGHLRAWASSASTAEARPALHAAPCPLPSAPPRRAALHSVPSGRQSVSPRLSPHRQDVADTCPAHPWAQKSWHMAAPRPHGWQGSYKATSSLPLADSTERREAGAERGKNNFNPVRHFIKKFHKKWVVTCR